MAEDKQQKTLNGARLGCRPGNMREKIGAKENAPDKIRRAVKKSKTAADQCRTPGQFSSAFATKPGMSASQRA